MAKTRSMTTNQDHDASINKMFKTSDNDGTVPWSDLNHDLLFLVMMQLGVVDFVAFSGVSKLWRSLALSNRNKFIVSRPPMSISNPAESNEEDYYCYLEEFDGRRFKTILPHSAGRTCVGFTCGYLVLFGSTTHDFWLVNPITRHELHFPDIPSLEIDNPRRIRAILVYSPSISGLVFVVLNAFTKTVLFSVAGTRAWNHVTSASSLHDLYGFKGKIYIITPRRLYELRLDPEPKLTLIKTKLCPKPGHCLFKFISMGENLYVMGHKSGSGYKLHELDLEEMEWVPPATEVDNFSVRDFKNGFAIKPEWWADP